MIRPKTKQKKQNLFLEETKKGPQIIEVKYKSWSLSNLSKLFTIEHQAPVV